MQHFWHSHRELAALRLRRHIRYSSLARLLRAGTILGIDSLSLTDYS